MNDSRLKNKMGEVGKHDAHQNTLTSYTCLLMEASCGHRLATK